MDTGIDLVLSRNTSKRRAIAYSTMIERHARIQSRAMAASQIVQNNDFLVTFPQLLDGHASDVACTAGPRIATIFPLRLVFVYLTQ
jgi:hypothetical protein